MKKVKVIIADDSVVYRSQIKAALQEIPWIDVVAVASNGRLALERFNAVLPDLVILDFEMREMNGLQTLVELKRRGYPGKVLVFSVSTKRGAESTMEALRLGASDFATKPDNSDSFSMVGSSPREKIKSILEPKITALFPDYSTAKEQPPDLNNNLNNISKIVWEILKPKIVVIGSSTGGPTVLEQIFAGLKTPIRCPIVIAQHMPPVFTKTFAERLQKVSGIPTFEASDGMALKENCIYVAPGNYHLRLKGKIGAVFVELDQGPLINSVRPAVDPLFSTAASIFKSSCLGIILTGMGADGKAGAMSVKQNGGAVVIQEEKSCVVYGMPGAVFASGAYDRIATPADIVDILKDKITLPEKMA